jgi:nicotinic acid mononucleotide adenylyltransferase
MSMAGGPGPGGETVHGHKPILLIDTATADASSTEVRRRAAAGEEISGLVPNGVGLYIERHGLYGARQADGLHGEDGLEA